MPLLSVLMHLFYYRDYDVIAEGRKVEEMKIWNDYLVGRKLFKFLSANPTKWSNTLKQFVGNLPTNCLSVFDHFVILALKGLSFWIEPSLSGI